MKVLMINGSPRPNGNTSLALREMETIFKAEGIETEIVQIGNKAIRGCIACGKCAEKGRCVFDDAVNEIAPKFEALLNVFCLPLQPVRGVLLEHHFPVFTVEALDQLLELLCHVMQMSFVLPLPRCVSTSV